MGGKETQTRYLSENELRFIIPSLPDGIDYPVQLIGGPHGALDIGNFRVDVSSLEVTPDSIEIASGSSTTLLFKIDYDVPDGGLNITVRTNIPESVIMPEAVITQGNRTVNIPVEGEGGKPGEQIGNLCSSLSGFRNTHSRILNLISDILN